MAEFFLLVLVSIFIIRVVPGRRINLWCGICIAIFACGSMTWILWTHTIPYVLSNYSQNHILIFLLKYLHIYLSILVYSQGPICFCTFFLICAGRLEERISVLKFFLLMNLPNLVINFVYQPMDWSYNLEYSAMMWGMYHWFYIPVTICIVLYVKELRNKNNYYAWNERFLGLIMILLAIYSLVLFYTCRMLLFTNFYLHFQPFMTWIFAVMFLCIIVWQGAAGIKINLELSELDSSIRMADSNMLFINHAIKGEINKIQSSLKLIEGDINGGSVKAYSRIIDNSCETLLDMLNSTKTQLQDISIQSEQVNVDSLIRRVVSGYENIIKQKGALIEVDIPESVRLVSDRNHLYNSVDNILKNALEALPESGGGVIKIRLEIKTRELVITVQDNGCGMDAGQLKEIRKPFFSTKQSKGNYGLGMTYCYRVIKKMKGHIAIESTLGVGTTVQVFLKR